jgi:uncharacterized protein (TIGR03083 family)
VPAGLLDWFHDGAANLQERFRTTAPAEQVRTWSADHTAGFWQRMPAIEAAVHRWDAENAVGVAQPLDVALAADAIGRLSRSCLPRIRDPVARLDPVLGSRPGQRPRIGHSTRSAVRRRVGHRHRRHLKIGRPTL